MNVEVHTDGTASFNNLTQEEGRTIWNALESLKDAYKKDVTTTASGLVEDEAFLYYELSKVAQLQFAMMEDYMEPTRHTVQEWFYL